MIKNKILLVIFIGMQTTACSPKESSELQAIFNKGTVLWSSSDNSEKNKQKACELFKIASEKEYIGAYYNLANCYQTGIGENFNSIALAEYWYLQGHNAGSTKSSIALAAIYVREYGTEEHIKKAVDILNKNNHDKYGAMLLADLYFKGKGVNRDIAKAMELTEFAASEGHIMAIALLYHIYDQGLFGQEKSKEKSDFYKEIFNTLSPFTLKWSLDNALEAHYTYGYGVEVDLKKAEEYKKKAASDSLNNNL